MQRQRLSGSPHTILVVDDDPEFRALSSRLLGLRGHRVLEAGNGRVAGELLARERPDLLIVDGLLPDGDGLSWLAARRAAGDRTPTVFVSSFWKDLASFRRLTGELGVALILHKPIEPQSFAQQLEETLDNLPAASGALVLRPRPREARPAAREVVPGAEVLLQGLVDEYRQALPGKVDALAARFVAVKDGRAELLGEARDAAHRLAGTAGSYGLPAVSQAASLLEGLAVRRLAGATVRPQEWAAALDQLAAVVELGLARPPELPGARRRAGSRVLLVDDDPAFRTLAVSLGRQRAIEIVEAEDGEGALASVAAGGIDAVLIDLRLGEGSEAALALARAVRALPGQATLPLAFVSAHGALADRIAAVHVGASLYLSKPIDADGLSTAVLRLTHDKRAARPRALLVDDDPDFLRLASGVLAEAGLDVHTLGQPERILESLDEVRPDVLILDVNMPGVSGLDVCRTIRAMPRWQDLVVLFVTARDEASACLDGYQAGADDYVRKPVVGEELLTRVNARLQRTLLMRERLERDALTGLPLRRTFLDALSARASESERRKRKISVALLDVDHFKQVNDRHGHGAGDRVLAALGSLLARRFRAEDLRGRWGGEEFVLAFFEEEQASVARILERVLEELRTTEFVGDHGERFHVTFSAGVASLPDESHDVQSLIAAADRRLYAAKSTGRNRIAWRDEP
jgi:diguanylate cyclase (GGDEF)-like protein